MRNSTSVISGLGIMALALTLAPDAASARGGFGGFHGGGFHGVSAESGPAAGGERAPWRPSAVFALQLSDGPAGVSWDAPVGVVRVGVVAGAVAGAAGDGVGQLPLASRPASPSLLLGLGAATAVRIGTAGPG